MKQKSTLAKKKTSCSTKDTPKACIHIIELYPLSISYCINSILFTQSDKVSFQHIGHAITSKHFYHAKEQQLIINYTCTWA